eukprot:238148-Chlamydomonas_euryale.AAC.1
MVAQNRNAWHALANSGSSRRTSVFTLTHVATSVAGATLSQICVSPMHGGESTTSIHTATRYERRPEACVCPVHWGKHNQHPHCDQ